MPFEAGLTVLNYEYDIYRENFKPGIHVLFCPLFVLHTCRNNDNLMLNCKIAHIDKMLLKVYIQSPFPTIYIY